MSKSQEKALKVATGLATAVLALGIAYGTVKTQMNTTIVSVDKHEVRIDRLETHMVEQRTDIKWIRKALEDK